MARPLPRLRRVEQLRRGAPGGRAAARQGPPRPADCCPQAASRPKPFDAIDNSRGRARRLRHRRVRPRARRRHRARLAGADRRRARHRQDHAAAAGGAPARPHARHACSTSRARSRSTRSSCAASGSGSRAAALFLLAETSLERILEEVDAPQAARRSSSTRSRPSSRSQLPVGARQHQPGARGGDAAAVRRQGPRHHDLPDRPRHQGRQPRRAQVARAHRRHRALLRGREAPHTTASCARSRTASAPSPSSASSR